MKFYLVRHGEIEANIRKVYAGRSPEKLTAKGRRQASMMAEELRQSGIAKIYCSPVRRALETAEIIGSDLNKKPILEPAFAELVMGPWEGKSEAEVQRDYPTEWQIWNTRPAELILPGRETLEELRQRSLQGLAAIQAQNDYSSGVLIVTHVAVIRVLLLYQQAWELNLYRTIAIPHGKIFLLEGLGDRIEALSKRMSGSEPC